MDAVPIFDFHTPWVALIQLMLFFALPQLVGLITVKLTSAKVKTYLLALLTLIGVILTWLLDVAVADAWATLDWTELVNIIVNWIVAWLLSNAAYKGVLIPTGAAESAAENTTIKLFGPDPARVEAEKAA